MEITIGKLYLSCFRMDNWEFIIHLDKQYGHNVGNFNFYSGIYYFIGIFAGFVGWKM